MSWPPVYESKNRNVDSDFDPEENRIPTTCPAVFYLRLF
jgi:hypothetical protein